MSYTQKTTGAKLYIGTSATQPPPVVGSDSFVQVTQLAILGKPAITQTPASFYILDTPVPQSNGSAIGDQDWTFKFFWDKGISTQSTLKADAKVAGGRLRNIRVDEPDGTRSDFIGFVTNFAQEQYEASGDASPPVAVDLTIRQTGDVTESTVP